MIMYALGYIVKPRVDEPIVKTGDIYLGTVPKGASVYVNGEIFKTQTPVLLDKLLPGEYDIKISLENYSEWHELLPVKEGEATVLDNIIMIPEEWESDPVSEEAFKEITPLTGTQLVICAKGSSLKNHFIYDSSADKSFAICAETSRLADCAVISYFTVDKSECFIIYAGSGGDNKYLWVKPSAQGTVIKDITALFADKPLWVRWDPGASNDIFTFYDNEKEGGYVNRLDVEKEAVYPEYIKEVRGMGVSSGEIYVIRPNFTVQSVSFDKKSVKEILDKPKLGRSIFGSSGGFFKVEPFVKEIIIFISRQGEIMANRLPYRFVDGGVEGVAFDETDERILAWTKNRIGILDFTTESTGSVDFETGPEFEWIFSGGRDIKEAYWAYGASHVIFTDGDSVFLLGLAEYLKPSVNELAQVKKGSSIFYSEQAGAFYYLEPEKGNLTKIDIVPPKAVIKTPKAQ